MKRLVVTCVAVASLAAGAACRKAPADTTQTPAAANGAAQPATPEPPKPMPAQLPDVLARVNGEAVTKADFDRIVKNIEMSAGQPIPAERRDDILRKALDQLVTYTVLSQEIKSRNISVTDAELDGNLKKMQIAVSERSGVQQGAGGPGHEPRSAEVGRPDRHEHHEDD